MHPTEGVSRRKRRAKALRSSDRGGAAWDKSRRFAAFHAHSGDWNERPPGQETPARQLASREGRPPGVVRGLRDADPVLGDPRRASLAKGVGWLFRRHPIGQYGPPWEGTERREWK